MVSASVQEYFNHLTVSLGRLSDILGRKGAMLLALSLFGTFEVIYIYIFPANQHDFRHWDSIVQCGPFNDCTHCGTSNGGNGWRRVRYRTSLPTVHLLTTLFKLES